MPVCVGSKLFVLGHENSLFRNRCIENNPIRHALQRVIRPTHIMTS